VARARVVTIRAAGPDDAATIARLLAAFRDWYGRSEPHEAAMLDSVRRIMETERAVYLVAADPPAGVAQLRFRHSVWTGADDCWLEDLFVLEEARGAGWGRALVEASIELAVERGCKRIELDVDEGNVAAQALYESLGFVSSKRPGERVFFMARKL
jgi:ribosomal protein S18 acetylase RimI-like enzyme